MNAGSNIGHKLSSDTKAKMSLAKRGLPSHRKGSVHSAESKFLMKTNHSRKIGVYVYDSNKIFLNFYASITDCTKETKIDSRKIRYSMLTNKIVNNKYYFCNKKC